MQVLAIQRGKDWLPKTRPCWWGRQTHKQIISNQYDISNPRFEQFYRSIENEMPNSAQEELGKGDVRCRKVSKGGSTYLCAFYFPTTEYLSNRKQIYGK